MTRSIDDAPETLGELTRGEHLVLWAFRAMAFGAGGGGLVRRQFDDMCGPVAAEAQAAIQVFVCELGRTGRRKVSVAAPGSFRLTRDEQLVLAVFAAAQAEDYHRLEAHLAFLLGEPAREPFPAAACLAAEALALNDLVLRMPHAELRPAPATRAADVADGVVTWLPVHNAR